MPVVYHAHTYIHALRMYEHSAETSAHLTVYVRAKLGTHCGSLNTAPAVCLCDSVSKIYSALLSFS